MPLNLSLHRVQDLSENLYQRWFPRVGLSLDWGGFTGCLQLRPDGLSLGLDEAGKSKLLRLQFLPRASFSLQIQGFSLEGKSFPLLETLSNLKDRGLQWPNLTEISEQQLKEVRSPEEVWAKINKVTLPAAG
jgi:hypothetical protein